MAAALVVLLAACAAAAQRASAASPVSVTVTPSAVSLTPGAQATGVLLLSNGANGPVTVRVDPSGNDESVDVVMPRRQVTLPAEGSAALGFTVTRSSEGTGQDTGVQFVVTSTQPSVATQSIVATLPVKAATSLALVQAKIESNVTNINENRPGAAALVVTNPREATARIDSIQVAAPDSIDVRLVCPSGRELAVEAGTTASTDACAPALAPRSQEVLPLVFETTDRVVPGPRTVLVKVTASGSDRDAQSVVASTTFTVDVFAESDILEAIGVPVFLLLPGVIIVLTAWFLISKLSPWRHVAGGTEIGNVVSAATATAILGLAVSLVVAVVYPSLTDWFFPGYERDYLNAYGFADFYYVIGYSFALAVLVWGLAAGGFVLARWLFLPWPKDDAPSLLRKVGLRGLLGKRARFPRVTVDGKKGLRLSDRTADKTLVVPVISVSVDTAKDPKLSGKIEDVASTGTAFRLWRLIDSARREEKAEIAYKKDDVTEPRLVERAKLTSGASESSIVEIASGN